jgi:hypothetical protein
MFSTLLYRRLGREDTLAFVYLFFDRKSIKVKLRERPVSATGTIDRLTAYRGPANLRAEYFQPLFMVSSFNSLKH